VLALMEELRRRGSLDYQLHAYGLIRHSFTKPPDADAAKDKPTDYSPVFDARSWATTIAFIQEFVGK